MIAWLLAKSAFRVRELLFLQSVDPVFSGWPKLPLSTPISSKESYIHFNSSIFAVSCFDYLLANLSNPCTSIEELVVTLLAWAFPIFFFLFFILAFSSIILAFTYTIIFKVISFKARRLWDICVFSQDFYLFLWLFCKLYIIGSVSSLSKILLRKLLLTWVRLCEGSAPWGCWVVQ